MILEHNTAIQIFPIIESYRILLYDAIGSVSDLISWDVKKRQRGSVRMKVIVHYTLRAE
jgi:hypothetical protein